MDHKFDLRLGLDKNELLWKFLEREVGASIPSYLKILLSHEAFTSFAVLAAMPGDIKEKLEMTAREDFIEFDQNQQQELLKKCRNNDIMSFKLREGDVIFLSLIKSTIIERGVHQLNEQQLAEEKKRKRSLLRDNPADDRGAEMSLCSPDKRQFVALDKNIDLEDSRRKLVRITNGWIINSFNCEGKEAFFITEEDIKLNISETSIGTTIRCRICFHDIKILTDAYEGKPIKFVISNFSRHCKTHGTRCKPTAYPQIHEYKPKPIEHYHIQEEYHIKEESMGGENDSTHST